MAGSAAQAQSNDCGAIFVATPRVEDRYAKALYELAAASNTIAAVQAELAKLQTTLQTSPDLTRLLQHPLVQRTAQAALLRHVASKIGAGQLVQNFLQLVAAKRRQNMLLPIIASFTATARRVAGEVVAEVHSAAPLSQTQQQQLAAVLSHKHQSRVTLTVSVNENLLGGLTVKIGSRLYDSTIASQLQRLQHTIGAA